MTKLFKSMRFQPVTSLFFSFLALLACNKKKEKISLTLFSDITLLINTLGYKL